MVSQFLIIECYSTWRIACTNGPISDKKQHTGLFNGEGSQSTGECFKVTVREIILQAWFISSIVWGGWALEQW